MREMQINHLRNYYSRYVFQFVKKYIDELYLDMKIIDIGAGHLRNLKLLQEFGFKNLYALDKEDTDNPLRVNLEDFRKHDIEKGIPYTDEFFNVVLCNYVLMFIDPQNIDFVVRELLRVTKDFLVIETNKQKYKKCNSTHFKDYNFLDIVSEIEKNPSFELLQVRKYHEKIIARRVG